MSDKVAQREAAMRRANEVRFQGAEVKREVAALDYASGLERVADLLQERDPRIEAVKVAALLDSVSRMGSVRIEQIIVDCKLKTGDKRVRALTDRQRADLADAVRGRAVLHWSAWKAAA